MRYLFIIQGEGRGHLTQAITMEKMLLSRGHDVVRMLVGKSPSRTLPAFFTNGVKAPLAYFESVNFVTAAETGCPEDIAFQCCDVAQAYSFLIIDTQ